MCHRVLVEELAYVLCWNSKSFQHRTVLEQPGSAVSQSTMCASALSSDLKDRSEVDREYAFQNSGSSMRLKKPCHLEMPSSGMSMHSSRNPCLHGPGEAGSLAVPSSLQQLETLYSYAVLRQVLFSIFFYLVRQVRSFCLVPQLVIPSLISSFNSPFQLSQVVCAPSDRASH
jgi:hypothetical protein